MNTLAGRPYSVTLAPGVEPPSNDRLYRRAIITAKSGGEARAIFCRRAMAENGDRIEYVETRARLATFGDLFDPTRGVVESIYG